MAKPYRIPLRGPWEYEPVTATVDSPEIGNHPLPKPARAHFPAGWDELFGTFLGCARFRRRFHRPTNLDPDELVFLELEAVGGVGRLSVNGFDLGSVRHSSEPQRFDVTQYLTGNDELLIELSWNGATIRGERGGLYAPVVLEIVQHSQEVPLGRRG